MWCFLKLTKQYSCKVISTTPQQIFYDIFVEIDMDDGVVELKTLVGLTGCNGCYQGCWAYLTRKGIEYKSRIKCGEYRFNVPCGTYTLNIPRMHLKRIITL